MAILDGVEIVYIERCRSAAPGQREIDLNLHVGARLPAYCTSMGKVLLATCARTELRRRCSTGPISSGADPTRSSAGAACARELDRVQKIGIAVNNEELSYGLRSIAAPVRGRDRGGGRRHQPGHAPFEGLHGGADRQPQLGAAAHGRRDLGPQRLPAGRGLTEALRPQPPPRM